MLCKYNSYMMILNLLERCLGDKYLCQVPALVLVFGGSLVLVSIVVVPNTYTKNGEGLHYPTTLFVIG